MVLGHARRAPFVAGAEVRRAKRRLLLRREGGQERLDEDSLKRINALDFRLVRAHHVMCADDRRDERLDALAQRRADFRETHFVTDQLSQSFHGVQIHPQTDDSS
jgi:hypothetical protein